MPASDAEPSEPAPLRLYIHWPYCQRICPYCDFNVYKARPVAVEAWENALTAALGAHARRWPDLRLASIFFGGGTPSLMPPDLVRRVIETARSLWSEADEPPEITLEANPTSGEQERFDGLRRAGVTRLSLGIQAFDDAALAFLGRDHSAAEAKGALDRALALFPQVGLDLIYARPDQSPDAWHAELEAALATGVGHLSAYQLTVEPGTALAKAVARGSVTPCDDDLAATLYDITQAVAAAAGLPAYEVSNHARPGAESRHNVGIWAGDWYAGIGPGAHGRLPPRDDPGHEAAAALATVAAMKPGDWLAKAAAPGTGLADLSALTARERVEELVMMGLRRTQGLAIATVERRTGTALDRVVPEERLREALQAGWLVRHQGRLMVPGPYRALTEGIALTLLAGDM